MPTMDGDPVALHHDLTPAEGRVLPLTAEGESDANDPAETAVRSGKGVVTVARPWMLAAVGLGLGLLLVSLWRPVQAQSPTPDTAAPATTPSPAPAPQRPAGLILNYSSGELPPDNIPRTPIAASIRVTVTWLRGAPSDSSFEVERAPGFATSGPVYVLIGTVTAPPTGADGRFELLDPNVGILDAPCYRARAIAPGVRGPYSAEVCVQRPPTSGPAPTGPALTAVLGALPDSYVISGSGFVPGSLVDISELPCGDIPCGAGPLSWKRGVQVDAGGNFSALYQAPLGYNPLDGRDYRLIVVTPSGVVWNDATPRVNVPLHHAGTAGPPAAGTGLVESRDEGRLLILAGALLLSAAAGMAGLGARRRLTK